MPEKKPGEILFHLILTSILWKNLITEEREGLRGLRAEIRSKWGESRGELNYRGGVRI
jgi:hypothetical protein